MDVEKKGLFYNGEGGRTMVFRLHAGVNTVGGRLVKCLLHRVLHAPGKKSIIASSNRTDEPHIGPMMPQQMSLQIHVALRCDPESHQHGPWPCAEPIDLCGCGWGCKCIWIPLNDVLITSGLLPWHRLFAHQHRNGRSVKTLPQAHLGRFSTFNTSFLAPTLHSIRLLRMGSLQGVVALL